MPSGKTHDAITIILAAPTFLVALGHGEGSLYTVRMSVQNLGKMDMYQWLYFLALHQRRHIAQMEQVYQEWQQSTS